MSTPLASAGSSDAAAAAAAAAEEQQKALETLHLILPERYTASALDNASLVGYRTLQQLQADTADFRRKYLNWRMQKPRGAKGETHDAVVGKTPAAALARRQPTLAAASRQASLVQSLRGDDPSEVSAAETAEAGDPSWLRFYFHPFNPAEEAKPLALCTATLEQITPRVSQIPRYSRDPATVDCWMMHLGVGQFHRSHQLVYLDDYLQAQESATTTAGNNKALKWASCGVGLMPWDQKMAEALRPQDLLFTVLSRASATSSARVIGSMLDYIFAPTEAEKACAFLVNPKLKIVSLTVTEKGYCQAVGGGLDVHNPAVRSDLQLLAAHPDGFPPTPPQTAIAFLLLGLRERRRRGIPAFTVLSCDNLPDNGPTARRVVCDFAGKLDEELAGFLRATVAFPATMVDRITPSTSKDHINVLEKEFMLTDRWPVVAEEFKQWVIEDRFPQGRPQWETVGALLVDDVRPFELMKLRLLNGAHSFLCYLAHQSGYRFVDDAMNDLHLSSFIRGYMDEVTSTIRNVTVELERYKEKVAERFANRMIKDTVLRIAEDGSDKFYNTSRDALEELLSERRHTHYAATGFACFIVFLANADPAEIKDSKKEILIPRAKACLRDVRNPALVRLFVESVFGTAIASCNEFVNQVTLALYAFQTLGVREVLAKGGVLQALLYCCLNSRLQELLDFARQYQ